MSIENSLLRTVLKRERSLFHSDYAERRHELLENLEGARVLIIGAAGSIGSAVIKQLLSYELSGLHLVDVSENSLAELVRDLRSSANPVDPPSDFRALPLALGSLELARFLKAEKSYRFVLNFAALKHVRSEKDPYSLMRMYNTNVFYFKMLLDKLREFPVKKVFSVSSDKAVNPAGLMGATKRFMEKLLVVYSTDIACSSARFANVAFSDGSLLYSYIHRFSKGQPLPVPLDIKRYFISHEEAAQLCLLSCVCGENRDLYFPKMDEDGDLISFSDMAELFLKSRGYDIEACYSEEEAKEAASRLSSGSKKWPVYFSETDTTGEKAIERFFRPAESVDFSKYRSIGVICQSGADCGVEVFKAMEEIENIKKKELWRKKDILDAIRIAVPELEHREEHRYLDQKM